MNARFINSVHALVVYLGTAILISSCAQSGPDDAIYACGVVIDKATEQPIQGAEVALASCGRGAFPNSSEITHTDGKGKFEVQSPPCSDRRAFIVIRKEGYADVTGGAEGGDFIFDT